MVHCDFEKGSQNQHFHSTLLVPYGGSEGVTTKEYSVFALHNVDNTMRFCYIICVKCIQRASSVLDCWTLDRDSPGLNGLSKLGHVLSLSATPQFTHLYK